MDARFVAIGLLALGAGMRPAIASAKDSTHAAKPAAATAPHGAAADTKTADGAKPHGTSPPASIHVDVHAKPAARDTHAAAAAAKGADAAPKGAKGAAAGDAHGKPATGSEAHAASGQEKPARVAAGNDLPSVAARIKQRMQETVAARAQHAAPAAAATPAAQATDASPAARRSTPTVAPARIRLSWRVGVSWPSELTDAEGPPPADGRLALSWR